MSRTAPETKSIAPAENKALGAAKPVDVEEIVDEPIVVPVASAATTRVRIVHYIDGYAPGKTAEVSVERAAQLVAGKYAVEL